MQEGSAHKSVQFHGFLIEKKNLKNCLQEPLVLNTSFCFSLGFPTQAYPVEVKIYIVLMFLARESQKRSRQIWKTEQSVNLIRVG